jgi:hypothetical protein
MEKRKHRSTKQAKQKIDNKGSEATGSMEQQSAGHAEHPAGGITEALRHQDEIVQEKTDEKV